MRSKAVAVSESSVVDVPDMFDDAAVESDLKDQDFVINNSQKKESIDISLPVKGLAQATAMTAKRFKVGTMAQTALIADILNVGGADLSQFTLSQSSTWRAGTDTVKKKENDIRQNFGEGLDNHCLVCLLYTSPSPRD